MIKSKPYHWLLVWGLVSLLSVAQAARSGDPDEGGIGGTGIAGFGHIQAFGSIFVNGREYFLNQDTQIIVDGKVSDEKALRLGGIVTVEGRGDPSSKTAQATRVISAHQLVGRIEHLDASKRTLTVLGQTVHVGLDTHIDGKSFDAMRVGEAVAVNGLRQMDGSWRATRLEPPAEAARFVLNTKVDGIDTQRHEIIAGPYRLRLEEGVRLDAVVAGRQILRGYYAGSVLMVDQVEPVQRGVGRVGDVVEIEGLVARNGGTRFISNDITLSDVSLIAELPDHGEDVRHAVVHGRVDINHDIVIERIEFEMERGAMDHSIETTRQHEIEHPHEGDKSPELERPEADAVEVEHADIDSIRGERIEVERPQEIERPAIEAPSVEIERPQIEDIEIERPIIEQPMQD